MSTNTPDAADAIRTIAHPQPIVVKTSTTLRQLARLMDQLDCSALVVSCHDGSHAVATERDIVRALAGGSDPDAVWAVDVMSGDVLGLDANEPIHEAARLMLDQRIRHVEVTGTDDELSIVSIRDLLGPFLTSIEA